MDVSEKIDVTRIRDQSDGGARRAFAQAFCNRFGNQGLTSYHTAQLAGVEPATIVHWLSGWDVPSTEQLARLMDAADGLNIPVMQPDVPARYNKQGEETRAAEYHGAKKFMHKLRHDMFALRDAAYAERTSKLEAGELPLFNDQYLESKFRERRSRSALYQSPTLLDKLIEPFGPEDRVSSFISDLCGYMGMSPGELSKEIGFKSSVLTNWVKLDDAPRNAQGDEILSRSLPNRENFLLLRDWLEEKFGSHGPAIADKATALFTLSATSRFTDYAHLRNLPPEFWEWKMLVTNAPERAVSMDAPSWGFAVTPALSKEQYVIDMRRALEAGRDDFAARMGTDKRIWERVETGKASEGDLDVVYMAGEAFNEARQGDASIPDMDKDIFREEVFASLPWERERFAPSPAPAKAPPVRLDSHQKSYHILARDLIGNDVPNPVRLPDDHRDFVQANLKEMLAKVDKAVSFARVSKTEASTIKDGLKELHAILNPDKKGRA